MADVCASSTKYFGDGSQKLFQFDWTYMSTQDIQAFILSDKGDWVNQQGKFEMANATTVEFYVAPPKPTDSKVENVWITRSTDIESMLATFYPGSSIRAGDLNNDFNQLRMAIQDTKCELSQDIADLDGNFLSEKDVLKYDDQIDGSWVTAPTQDDKLASAAAISARLDSYVQSDTPKEVTVEQEGKTWENTDQCWSSYWNDQAGAWVAYVNTGPRGAQGAKGPKGDKGDKGNDGAGLEITDVIDVPGPPSQDGTVTGQLVIDSNQEGWWWSGSDWDSIGVIKGPKGDAGTAATIAVGTTTTGQPGTDASVVNSGSSSAAVFDFTIPQGAKGDKGNPGTPGTNGTGIVDEIQVTSPIEVNNADPTKPILSINISALTALQL